jgi:MSHA biogenesis protein MshE
MVSSMGIKPGRPRIGDLLVGEGVLSPPSLERALAAQQRTRSEVRLGSALIGLGVITEDALLGALARAHGCPTVGAAELDIADPAAV